RGQGVGGERLRRVGPLQEMAQDHQQDQGPLGRVEYWISAVVQGGSPFLVLSPVACGGRIPDAVAGREGGWRWSPHLVQPATLQACPQPPHTPPHTTSPHR